LSRTNPLSDYLQTLRANRGRGVRETSNYQYLANLLNEIGKTLKPKVECVLHPRNIGAGIPDAGLYTPSERKSHPDDSDLALAVPERGVIEAKPTDDNTVLTASGQQVSKYWARYKQVLVTNFWQFIQVGSDRGSNEPIMLEPFQLADSEEAFWKACETPEKSADLLWGRFSEYLKRVMLQRAQIDDPSLVASFLASYAREARLRIESQPDLDDLKVIRDELEKALGVKFKGAKGEHFFRSSLVQTLFYGVFSAWVLWHREKPGRVDQFRWNDSTGKLRVAALRKLFYLMAEPGQMEELKLNEVLDWTGLVFNRVNRGAFFSKFQEEDAVQYFYEPFLEAYDPALRKELGVWFTPREIVKYQVARVDAVLRDKEGLDIADGLANPDVYVLDPCCGTAAYLVEVLETIHRTLKDKAGRGEISEALVPSDLVDAATKRIFGFEILPAPFAVAHMQLNLLLQSCNAPIGNKRVGVYLTNALTGWGANKQIPFNFKEFKDEHDAADGIKTRDKIIVIIGNPPYNGFAGVATQEESDLSNAYRTTKRAPKPQGQGLNELYVRFFRMAERRIVDINQPAKGIVSFISNYSWLDGLSHTGMRERYLEVFDRIWIDNLHGDRIISEYAPDGRSSETVFAMSGKAPGIKIGTAISLMVKGSKYGTKLLYRDMNQAHADERRAALLINLNGYKPLEPVLEIGFPFKPCATGESYLMWRLLPELFPVSFPGVKTSRDDVVVDVDYDRLEKRMKDYFNPNVSHDEMRSFSPQAMADTGTFKAAPAREQLVKRGFKPEFLVRYCYRPFDVRWLYWEPETNLLDRKREDYFPHVSNSNVWLEARQRQTKEAFDRGFFVRVLADNFGSGVSNFFPLYLCHGATLENPSGTPTPNVSDEAAAYLAALKAVPEDLFFHSLAILHAPAYRAENGGALRQNWPRVPLPDSPQVLRSSAGLGRLVAALLDTETEQPEAVSALGRPELKNIGVFSLQPGHQLDEESDFKVTASWGHAGKEGVTMPGKGSVVERAAAQDAPFGKTTTDIYLNKFAFWSNIPTPVWEYTLGGYQVIKKWLSYREHALLGRPLKKNEEVLYVTQMARRIAALILLQPSLDKNYAAVKVSTSSLSVACNAVEDSQ